VLDLSENISGPYCAKLLADYGAEVIKVERPGGGDAARSIGPFLKDEPHPEKSGLFLYLNTNKKGITLNLKDRSGQGILKRLVQQADVLVQNYEPRLLPGLGLCYEELEQVKPGLIMTSISYFGQTGPYRDYKGSEMIALALGGLMYMTGAPDREPLKGSGFQAEFQAGLNAAVAAMTALYFREATGQGQHIDVSVMEVVASILEAAVLNHEYNGTVRGRAGARHHSAYPSTILPCRDGYVHVHASTDWEAFSRFMEAPGLLDPKFEGAHRLYADEMDELMLPWLLAHDADEIFTSAQTWRFPFAKVLDIDELLEDVQYKDRGFWVEVDHPIAGWLTYPGAPFKMEETPWKAGRAPLLGEHNEEIYCGRLGFTREDLVLLRESGVV